MFGAAALTFPFQIIEIGKRTGRWIRELSPDLFHGGAVCGYSQMDQEGLPEESGGDGTDRGVGIQVRQGAFSVKSESVRRREALCHTAREIGFVIVSVGFLIFRRGQSR